jgi:hypothetical protein
MRRRSGPIRPTRDGGFVVDLPDNERRLIASLVDQLRGVLTAGDDPDLTRLFPTAYPDDPTRDAEYQALVHDELLEKRLAALDVIEETLEAPRLDETQLTAWMNAVNAVRLVLGTKLDVTEDLDWDAIDSDDPQAFAYAVYQYLTELLAAIVDALSP